MRLPFKKNNSSEENHFWISISDLMTTLLFVFILILAVTILDLQSSETVPRKDYEIVKNQLDMCQEKYKELETKYKELLKKFNDLKKQLNKNKDARTELLQLLQHNLSQKGIHVEIVAEEGVMRITKERLFDTAKAEVKDKREIEGIANELLLLLQQKKYNDAINTIYIEGHTDSVPLDMSRGGLRWTNMELSTQRAINTYLVIEEFAKDNNIVFNSSKFSYSGYAATRPIKGTLENNSNDRARNRRIQFFFAINPPKGAIDGDQN